MKSANEGHATKNLGKYKIKFMIVYFNSIKNLCKHINNNLFNIADKENKNFDNNLNDVYQNMRILNI